MRPATALVEAVDAGYEDVRAQAAYISAECVDGTVGRDEKGQDVEALLGAGRCEPRFVAGGFPDEVEDLWIYPGY